MARTGAFLLFGGALLVYGRTLCRTVGLIDSGELIAVCHGLGIAHPTGYPLYTLLGRFFALLPTNPPALSVNFASALFGAAAVGTLGIVAGRAVRFGGAMARHGDAAARHAAATGGVPPAARVLVIISAGLLFGFSRTMWRASTEAEVYSLATLLLLLVLWAAWPLVVVPDAPHARSLPLTGYLWGLALGNHMGAVLLAPLLLDLLIRHRVWRRGRWRGGVAFVVGLLLGLSVYLYLPIRAALDPPLNWGDPDSLSALLRHVSGWQYRVWMFTGGADALRRSLRAYAGLLSRQFPPPVLLLAAPGAVSLHRRHPRVLRALAILFLSDLVYSLNYEIPDIDPYFLPSFAVVAVLINAGALALIDLVSRRVSRRALLPIAALSLLLPLSAFRMNLAWCDRSRDRMALEFATNLLEVVPPGAVVLTRTWDLYAPVLYLQRVEGIRPDVVMIDFELMRRSWYVRHLAAAHPEVFGPARRETAAFLRLVRVFEAGGPFDGARLDRAFYAMLNALLLSGRPAFVDFDDDPRIAPALIKWPEGVIFRLTDAPRWQRFDRSRLHLASTLDPSMPRDARELWIRSLYEMYARKEARSLREIGRGIGEGS